MSSLFTSRRKPKRVAREESGHDDDDIEEDTGPVVRRPAGAVPKNKSKLRMTFDPEGGDNTEENVSSNEQSMRRNRLGPSTVLQNRLNQSPREGSPERPSYSKAYLDELRNSTPATPKDLSEVNTPTDDGDDRALDIENKFGKSAISSGAIPSAAEIKEKKERRARLAKEQGAEDFIALEDYDSDGEFRPQRMQVGSYLRREDEKDTRLIRDDEDIAEGFDDFVEDSGRVTLSRKGLKEQSRKEREQMREMIEEAEDDTDNSDSDAEQNRAYEFAQTHHGMEGLAAHRAQTREAKRPRQPRETTPIPKLAAGLARLKEQIQKIEFDKAKIEKRRADMARERAEIVASQQHIQKSLEEAGRELEALQAHSVNGHVRDQDHITAPERGLESLSEDRTTSND